MNAAPAPWPSRPYPGLRPFEASEWPIFFGRERMIDDVIERLARNNLVLIHGASGSGKSSLVRAGVMPKLARQHLRHGKPWLTCALRPSGGPLWNLAVEFARLEGCADDPERIGTLVGRFSVCGASLASVAGGLRNVEGKKLCVLVDQFEELFRFEKRSREEAELFVDLLVRAAVVEESASAENDVHVVVTMRSEFLGECARFDKLAETINRTQYLVPRMDEDALVDAVRRPAAMFGGLVDERLTHRLIGLVRGREDELPLIQHGLMMMWADAVERTAPGQRIQLDGAIVDRSGGLAGLLSGHADAVMDAVAPDAARARVVESVFRELTDVNAEGSAIRRPRRLADLAAATGAGTEQLLPILEAFRAPEVAFLTPYAPQPIKPDDEIDISHEALIRCWRRVASAKNGWLRREFDDGLAWRSLLVEARAFEKNDQRVLSAAATDDRGLLYAAHNEAWTRRYGGGWRLVGRLLEASRNAAANARRNAAIRTASIAGLAIIALALAAFMAIALQRERAAVALEQRYEANLQDALGQKAEAFRQKAAEDDQLKNALANMRQEAATLSGALGREASEEALLETKNEQFDAQIQLTENIFAQLTQAGQQCPRGITASQGLLDKAKAAADHGDRYAEYLLGTLFECGLGVPQDRSAAIGWYEKAAGAGSALAMRIIGIYYERGVGVALDFKTAREWYEKAAAGGDAAAMTNIGYLYDSGRGVPKDFGKARAWFERAATAGDATAMRNLGALYEDGEGAQPDLDRARKWYERAAGAGDAMAMRRLGAIYVVGKGVPRDQASARSWYEKAASAGDPDAKRDLDNFDFLPEFEGYRAADIAEDFSEAVRIGKGLAQQIEADERRRSGKPGQRTAEVLGGLAWDELMIRDYAGALDCAMRAHGFAPEVIWIEENHAHALAFLGRLSEARELYFSHRNDEDIGLGVTNWRQAVLDDFAEFRKAGLTHPLMQEIEAEFEASAK